MDSEAGGRAQAGAMRLVGIDGAARRELILSAGHTRIGSAADNDLVIAEPTVSRRHAEVRCRRGRYRLTDLGSTNGTFVNGRRLASGARLKGGDEVRFGTVRFIAHDPAAASVGRRRMHLRTAIELIIALFVAGFGITEYLLITGGRPFRAVATSPSAPATTAHGATAIHESSPEKVVGGEAGATPEAGGPAPPWLSWINHYRAMVTAPPIGEDPELTAGDEAHARYLVVNYGEAVARGVQSGAEVHTEKPAMPGYSEAGLKAASASDIAQWAGHGDVNFTAESAIDGWMSIPFHRLPILSPRLKRAGFGRYCEGGKCAAALNVLTDSEPLHPAPTLLKYPIEFPPDGSTIRLRKAGIEWPDPLTSCPGYALPTGPPITIQLGAWYQPVLTAYSLKRDGAEVEACGFDANSYANPDAGAQRTGRDALRDYGAVVIIPREPLVLGSSYTVSMTVDGKTYEWSFRVE